MTKIFEVLFILVSECVENTNWETTDGSFRCSDYAANKWCENGEVGSGWDHSWSWITGINGQDARSVCCVCGGDGTQGNYRGK